MSARKGLRRDEALVKPSRFLVVKDRQGRSWVTDAYVCVRADEFKTPPKKSRGRVVVNEAYAVAEAKARQMIRSIDVSSAIYLHPVTADAFVSAAESSRKPVALLRTSGSMLVIAVNAHVDEAMQGAGLYPVLLNLGEKRKVVGYMRPRKSGRSLVAMLAPANPWSH